MKHLKTFESFLNDAANESTLEISGNAYDMWNDKKVQRELQDIKIKIVGDMKGVMTLSGDKEELNKVRAIFGIKESVVKESYKQIPYNVKVAGKYEVLVGRYPTVSATVTVAGFERQNDDSDSLYLDDSDEFKPMFGGFIVKNSDMKKLEKGITVNAVTSKDNKDAKITRIGDL